MPLFDPTPSGKASALDREVSLEAYELLPGLKGAAGVDFHLEKLVLQQVSSDREFNVLDPQAIQRLVEGLHARSSAHFSAGGWMEERSTVFRGTYMEADSRFIHLGVDINVPAGMMVRFPIAGEVLKVEVSDDREVGWGARVDIAPIGAPYVFLLGHLDPSGLIRSGACIPATGAPVGTIGAPPTNGNVFPHLHLQAVRREVYDREVEIDGYGRVSEREQLAIDYPEPLRLFQLLRREPTQNGVLP
jgi:murein DD-endopeptidase MepM/ murein hydrolase activator NlpD